MQYVKETELFLRRSMKDIHINAYMKGLFMALQANCDIQYVLDAYTCVMYIHEYITNAKKGMNTLMAEACKEAKDGNMTLKQIPKCCRITSKGGMS